MLGVEQLWNKFCSERFPKFSRRLLNGAGSFTHGQGASASDRFEACRAMALESLVEVAQLEVVDRVGPVSVVPPKLHDRDPTLPRESIHVARWNLS
jgi:hypothetical protein